MDTKVLIKGESGRLPWIDYAKAMCMLCVILTHNIHIVLEESVY